MGILDDAIRQHLDLKRRLGAEEDELKRLESEAFGPPSRPGDPDFPDTGEGEALGGEGVAAPPAPEADGVETPLASDPPAQPVQPPPEATEPPADQPAEPSPETAEASVVGDVGEPGEVGEQARTGFYDQGAEELAATTQAEPEAPSAPEAEAPPAEPEAPVEPEEPVEPEAPVGPPPAPALDESVAGQPTEEQIVIEPPSDELEGVTEAPAEAEPSADEPPIESLDTVEHHFEEASDETGEGEVVEGELAEPEVAKEEGDAEGDDEDVLEETPEFLRDQPEDDELWFEQGEPKDFDF
jgi:hypothetical protein